MLIPKGFSFKAAQCGFKHKDRYDLGVMVSQTPAIGAGVFTRNKFQAAPVQIARQYLTQSKTIRAIIANSGQANACTGAEGLKNCIKTTSMMADLLECEAEQVLPASTGVIGDQLKMELWQLGLADMRQTCPLDVAKAIMTTDTFPKLVSRSVQTAQGEIRLLGMAKGAGMICPDMATMLSFILCDAQVGRDWWQAALSQAADNSFNCITVDGDTSTNDCILALANGQSGIDVDSDTELQDRLQQALTDICQELAYLVVQDAEGGTKVLRIQVKGAADKKQAKLAAQTVGNSPLVKTALYGQDPNWGRIVAALGRSGAEFEPDEVCVSIGESLIFDKGRPVAADWDSLLAPVLRRSEVVISIVLGSGAENYELLASDLTEGYIQINAEYRT